MVDGDECPVCGEGMVNEDGECFTCMLDEYIQEELAHE
jgi:hypothetical protein